MADVHPLPAHRIASASYPTRTYAFPCRAPRRNSAHEPYLDGYPAGLVKFQMIHILDTLRGFYKHDDPEFRHHFVTANAIYEAADRDLHNAR